VRPIAPNKLAVRLAGIKNLLLDKGLSDLGTIPEPMGFRPFGTFDPKTGVEVNVCSSGGDGVAEVGRQKRAARWVSESN
jgi:hypothetical protein